MCFLIEIHVIILHNYYLNIKIIIIELYLKWKELIILAEKRSRKSRKSTPEKVGILNKSLNFIEFIGNKLPDPVTLFVLLSILTVVVSFILGQAGVGVEYEVVKNGTSELVKVDAINLLTKESMTNFLTNIVNNFTSFPPLGVVLVSMLGVGVAEGLGLIDALIKRLVLSTPKRLVTVVVVFLGVLSNIASDAGYVVLVPLGAIIFKSFGRNPIAGIAAAFAGVSGGFSANLLIGTLDPLLTGISQSVANIIDPNYLMNPTCNYYFMVISTFLITIVGTIVTEYIVIPRLDRRQNPENFIEQVEDEKSFKITKEERKGLVWAGISLLIFIIIIVIGLLPGGMLRNQETGSIINKSPFIQGIVVILSLGFLIPGVFFGIGSGKVKKDGDIIKAMSKSMSTMGGYLVLAFFSAQFIKLFEQSNIATIIAVKGADFLENIGFVGVPLIIAFIIISGFINLFIGSASAKWAIMAPIFVPLFMRLGYSPEFTQLAYRVGDSTTNIITPLLPYFPIIVTLVKKYDPKSGIGTLISLMLPYSIAFLTSWILLLVVWMMLGLPIGPGATIFL